MNGLAAFLSILFTGSAVLAQQALPPVQNGAVTEQIAHVVQPKDDPPVRLASLQHTPRQSAPEIPLVLAAGEVRSGAADMAKLGIGLAPVADWSTQQPFLDVMKTARPWLGHMPGQFGGMGYEDMVAQGVLDANGWPLRMPPQLGSIGTLVLTDMPSAAVSLAGRYQLAFEGSGIVEVSGRARNVRYGKGEITFDYDPGPGPVDIRIQRTNPADPVRNITVIKQENLDRYAAGERFNPVWIAHVKGFKVLRFMDWMATNNSTLSDWDTRPKPGDVTYTWQGVPIEVQVALANELGIDPWFNVPHLADDTFVQGFAGLVKDNLDPELTAYVEFSNEVWNWQFTQARWANEQALARWGQKDAWIQYYGMRAMQVAQIWSEVFGEAAEDRLINVIATQTGWIGLEEPIFDAPLWQAEAPGNPAPVSAFDAYAITGYFGGVMGVEDYSDLVQGWLDDSFAKARDAAKAAGLSGEAEAQYVAKHRFDHATALAAIDIRDGSISGTPGGALTDLTGRVWPYHAQVARAHGLELVAYEGGTHIVGIGPQVDNDPLTEFLHHLNYSAEMGAIYVTLLDAWRDVGGGLFAAFNDVYAPSKWGSWGGLRHLDDANPRWDALISFQ